MSSNRGFIILAAILAALIGFRYVIVSKYGGGSPGSPSERRTGSSEAPGTVPGDQFAPKDDPIPQVAAPPPAPPQPEAKPYPVRTKEGALMYENSVVAKLPENPPGVKPDPLQKLTRDPKAPDPNAAKDNQEGKADRRASKDKDAQEARMKSKAELALLTDEVNKRISVIMAPVDAVWPLRVGRGQREACLADPTAAAAGPGVKSSTFVPTAVLRQRWEINLTEMLCRGSPDLCRGPILLPDFNIEQGSRHCHKLGIFLQLRAAALAKEDEISCRIVLAEGAILIDSARTYEDVAKLPGAKMKNVCGLLSRALKGDLSLCGGELGSYFQEEDAQNARAAEAECRATLSFVEGKASCRKIKDARDREFCDSMAAARDALKSNNAAACGGDRRCRALLNDPSICGAAALSAAKLKARGAYCDHVAGQGGKDGKRRVSEVVNKAYEELAILVKSHEGFFKREGFGDDQKKYLPPHLKAIRDAEERLNGITKAIGLTDKKPED